MFRPSAQLPKHVAVAKQKTAVFGGTLKDLVLNLPQTQLNVVHWKGCLVLLLHRATVRAFFCRNSAKWQTTTQVAHFGANKIMECSVNKLRTRAFIDLVSRNSHALLSSITSTCLKALTKVRPLPASPNQINVHHKLNAQSNSAINRIHFLHGN